MIEVINTITLENLLIGLGMAILTIPFGAAFVPEILDAFKFESRSVKNPEVELASENSKTQSEFQKDYPEYFI